jgi:hypothetical protein
MTLVGRSLEHRTPALDLDQREIQRPPDRRLGAACE